MRRGNGPLTFSLMGCGREMIDKMLPTRDFTYLGFQPIILARNRIKERNFVVEISYNESKETFVEFFIVLKTRLHVAPVYSTMWHKPTKMKHLCKCSKRMHSHKPARWRPLSTRAKEPAVVFQEAKGKIGYCTTGGNIELDFALNAIVDIVNISDAVRVIGAVSEKPLWGKAKELRDVRVVL